MKLIFFGDSEWGSKTLKACMNVGHEVLGVVGRTSATTSCLAQVSQDLGIEYRVFGKVNSDECKDWIKAKGATLGVCVSYDQIFREATCSLFPAGAINAHCGKLPHYRGRNILNWALINGEVEFGITVHYIDKAIDTGDIIHQVVLPITQEDDYQTLLTRSIEAMPAVVMKAVGDLEAGTATPLPQRFWEGSFFSKRLSGDESINWERSSQEIFNFVRAITRPAPGARAHLARSDLVVWKVRFEQGSPHYRAIPGEVVAWSPDKNPVVKTGDSVICLLDYEWLSNGPKLRVGNRFIGPEARRIQELESKIESLESMLLGKEGPS